MKKLLLDTHALLWWLSEPQKLSKPARRAIEDGYQQIYFSTAAIWEMAIKKSIGRLDFPGNLEEVLREQRIDVLPIAASHALAVCDLPLLHRDPFDRMQIAQARAENLTLVTRDPQLAAYDVEILVA